MAIIKDHSNFKIEVKPEYTNWWSYYFTFFYRDRPVFNPEIMDEGGFKADEYEKYQLLATLEKALACKTDGEIFFWSAWEEETEVILKSTVKEQNYIAFDFSVNISERCFKDGEMNYLFQNAGVMLFIHHEELKKFYEDLKSEMAEVVKKLDPPREITGSQPF